MLGEAFVKETEGYCSKRNLNLLENFNLLGYSIRFGKEVQYLLQLKECNGQLQTRSKKRKLNVFRETQDSRLNILVLPE